jgi:hypothetical protein
MAAFARKKSARLAAALALVALFAAPLTAPRAVAEEASETAVTIEVSDIEFERAGNFGQFTYTREFHDHGGLGAKLRHGRVCYSSGGCISAPVDYIVEPGGVLKQEGQLLIPMSNTQTFDFTYTGEDGEGDKIIVTARILVVGDQMELRESQ